MVEPTQDLFVTIIGDSPATVIHVHGGGLDSRVWQHLAEQLVSMNIRSVCYDRRGCGSSRHGAREGNHTSDLISLLQMTGDRPMVIGSSIGGAVALEAALTAPDRIRALVLIGPTLTEFPVSPSKRTRVIGLRQAALRGATQLANAFLADPHLTSRSLPEADKLALHQIVADNQSVWTDPWPVENPGALLDRAAGVQVPVRVLVGEWDDSDNLAIARVLAERLPMAKLEIVRGAGHLVELEQPRVVAEAVAGLRASTTEATDRSAGTSTR